jgi:hypothetical protein
VLPVAEHGKSAGRPAYTAGRLWYVWEPKENVSIFLKQKEKMDERADCFRKQ